MATKKTTADEPGNDQRIDDEGRPTDGAPTPSGTTADPESAPPANALPAEQQAGGPQPDKRGGRKQKKVVDLTSEDLVDQDTGHPRPISVQTKNLSATVSGDLGRVLVKLANRGYIGEEPVVLLGEDVAEFREIVDLLDKAVPEHTKANAKK